ncbi:hypothetical protein GQ457_02G038540 [Hibiscus cannabinus]
MMSMLRMIEVFERVGDKIELYRRYLTKCFKEFWAAQMACMLINVIQVMMNQIYQWLPQNSSSTCRKYLDVIYMKACSWRVVLQRFTNNMMWIPCGFLGCPTPTGHQCWRSSKYSIMRMTLTVLSPHKVSLEKLCHHPYLNDWTPKKSTFKLVCILCLPQLKDFLESIKLVACKTDEIEAIGCSLARQGKLIELAGKQGFAFKSHSPMHNE